MDEVLEYISLYRVCWIGGRLRYGKTALATIIAKRMLEAGLVDGVISNFPTVFPAHIGRDDGTMYNRCILYDEAWQDHDNRTSMSNDRVLGAWMGKLGAYLICPSVHPIDRRLRSVEIKPDHINLLTGRKVWQYTVQSTDAEQRVQGQFSVDLKEIYGKYATSYIPVGDCGIIDRFLVTYYMETGTQYDSGRDKTRAGQEVAGSQMTARDN